MKILFICGSLEPGRDGVGDYARQLAQEVKRQGNESAILALNDRFTSAEQSNSCMGINGYWQHPGEVALLRYSHQLSWATRIYKMKCFARAWKPDWLSLQFVPYAYHRKGIPLGISAMMEELKATGPKLHVMFHELWVVDGVMYNPCRLITSMLQRRIVRKVGRQSHCIHTHLPRYFNSLSKMSLRPNKLPLFSNIPVYQSGRIGANSETSVLEVAIFSHFSRPSTLIKWLLDLADDCRKSDFGISFHFCGNISPSQETAWRKALGSVAKLTFHGWTTEWALSEILSKCDAAATGYPRRSLGKSGTVAACITHGLPIIAPNCTHFSDPPFLDKDLEKCLVAAPTRQAIAKVKPLVDQTSQALNLGSIAGMFMRDLTST